MIGMPLMVGEWDARVTLAVGGKVDWGCIVAVTCGCC